MQSACTKKSLFFVRRAEMPLSSSFSFATSPFCINYHNLYCYILS